jgi:hypothetical protein
MAARLTTVFGALFSALGESKKGKKRVRAEVVGWCCLEGS